MQQQEKIEFNTGDILLFTGASLIDRAIEVFSGSRYSHVGIILKDPHYIDEKLKGYFFLESTVGTLPDAEDNKLKFGVILHRLVDVLREHSNDRIFVRHLECTRTDEFYNLLLSGYNRTKDIPYDLNPVDWIRAQIAVDIGNVDALQKDLHLQEHDVQSLSALWCSAFVGYMFTTMKLLSSDTPWTILAPTDFSQERDKQLTFVNCKLSSSVPLTPSDILNLL